MATVRSSAPGVDCAQGELLPQITLAPKMVFAPQITFEPQMAFVPLTFEPQMTLVAKGEVLPQITLDAPTEFNCNLTVELRELKVATGEAADPEGMVVSLYAAQISTCPAPMEKISAFSTKVPAGLVTVIVMVAGKPRHAVRINLALT